MRFTVLEQFNKIPGVLSENCLIDIPYFPGGLLKGSRTMQRTGFSFQGA